MVWGSVLVFKMGNSSERMVIKSKVKTNSITLCLVSAASLYRRVFYKCADAFCDFVQHPCPNVFGSWFLTGSWVGPDKNNYFGAKGQLRCGGNRKNRFLNRALAPNWPWVLSEQCRALAWTGYTQDSCALTCSNSWQAMYTKHREAGMQHRLTPPCDHYFYLYPVKPPNCL